MKKTNTPPSYTIGEELVNAISHGVGAALAIAALVLLVVSAAFTHNPLYVVCAAIYGTTLILMYLFSTLYHSISNPKAKAVFRIFDHSSIFLLIAGTYMPYALLVIGGAKGITLCAVIWAFAILGIVLNAVNMEKFKVFSYICYVIMGWAIIFYFKTLVSNMQLGGLIFLVAGGIIYTLGIIFYAFPKLKYMHSIWHFFVLGGSILHFFSIYLFVIGR